MHLLIIGGSDAGISAALRAQELDSGVEVSMALADDFPNFSICGLPYFLSGETPDWRDLAHRTRVSRPQYPSPAQSRNPSTWRLNPPRSGMRERQKFSVTTNWLSQPARRPVRPNLPGSTLDGVYLLHTMDHSFAVHRHLNERRTRYSRAASAPAISAWKWRTPCASGDSK